MSNPETPDLAELRQKLNLPKQMTFLKVAFNCLVHGEGVGDLYFEDPADLELAQRINARPELWLTRAQQFDGDVNYFRQMADEDPSDPDGQVWAVVMAPFIATQRTLLDQNARLREALAFYADPDMWETFVYPAIGRENGPTAYEDAGDTARQALAEPPPPGKPSDDLNPQGDPRP